MNDLFFQSASGVLSSILAVIFVELYLAVRRRQSQRHLKKILSFSGPNCTVLGAAYPLETDSPVPLMGMLDVFALVEVVNSCRLTRIEPIVQAGVVFSSAPSGDLICVGGPGANPATKGFLETFCPGFQFDWTLVEGSHKGRWMCGGHEHTDNNRDTFAFIAKLAPVNSGLPATIILIWGLSSVGTAAAAYFVSNHAKLLPTRRDESVFLAVPVKRSMDYRSIPPRYIDITTAALALTGKAS